MVQQVDGPKDLRADHHVGLHPTRFPAQFATDLSDGHPGPAAGRSAGVRQLRAGKRAIRQVVVIDVVGRLGDIVEDLDRVIQLALAEGPRGVVCDLSAVIEGAEQVAVDLLATAGRHLRDWGGIPVAIACPDPLVRDRLAAHPLGKHLIVTPSLISAVSAVLATPSLSAQWLQLAPHPTAPRASRDFVTRTLLDWRLGRVIPFASLVVSELVASSTVHAGTAIDLSVVWDRGALRLTVRDHGSALPAQRPAELGLHGRGLTVVAGLSRAFGVMPTADGGKVVWAVLEALRPGPSSRHIAYEPSIAAPKSPGFTDSRGLADLAFWADASGQPD